MWLSQPGRGRTTQSLYALKLRATIIGHTLLLVVYGSLSPLLGETYMLHLGAHLSSFLSCVHLGVCCVFASCPYSPL